MGKRKRKLFEGAHLDLSKLAVESESGWNGC